MKKQDPEYDPTPLTDPDSIDGLNHKTVDLVIRGVLMTLYNRAP